MPKTLLDLAASMERRARELPKAVTDRTNVAVIQMVSTLARNTPVDTSQALSSWILTLDSPSSRVGKAHFEGEKGSTRDQSAEATIVEAWATLRDRQPGQTIFITNNQPYIRGLNDGTISKQPGNFVALSVVKLKWALSRIKLKW